MRMLPSAFLAMAALGVLAAAARAEVDVEVPISFKAKGTITGPGEQDVYRFLAERGAVFTLAAAPIGRAPLALTVTLLDGNGDPAVLAAGSLVTVGSKITGKGLAFALTGPVRIVVSGEGTGDYSLSLKGKGQASWKTTVAMPASPSYDQFQFAALPGSTVSVLVKAAKGSAAVPRLQTLYDTSENYSVDLSAAGKFTATSHAAIQADVQPGVDEMVQDFQNTGAGGDVDVTVKVKPPKGRPGKLDLRGAILGRPAGGETLVSRTIGVAGGTVTVDDEGSDLHNASVTIPPDVLASNMSISVASTEDPPLGSPDVQSAGPAVDLQPSGIVFSSPVTVVLPIDFTKIPAGATPDDITVRIVEENGSAVVVAPQSVDALNGTVTVLTNGFSVCIPIIPPGPPSFGYNPNGTLKPGGDEFWFAGLRAEFQQDVAGNDSRYRQLSLEEGQISLFSDYSLQVASQQTQVEWSNADTGPGQVDGTVTTTTKPNGDTVGWVYGADGQTIEVTGGGSQYPIFAMSRDGNVLSSRPNDTTNPECEDIFAFRKPVQTPTLALAAGTYQGCGFTLNANAQGGNLPARVQFRRNFGTMTIGADGSISLTFNQRIGEFDAASNQWTTTPKNETVSAPAGSVVVDPDGTLLATFPDKPGGTVEPKRIRLGRDFKGGFFTNDAPKSGNFILFLFAREGTGLSTASLNGTYRGGLFDPDLQQYNIGSPPGVNVADFEILAEGLTCTLTGGATGNLAFHDHKVIRDTGTTGGVDVQEKNDSASVSVGVTAKGKVTFSTGQGAAVGAVAPDASFIVLGTDVSNADGDFFVGICVQSPPLKP